MDALLVMIGNWRTTLLGLLSAVVIYEAGVGNKLPATRQEWWAFALGVLFLALGLASKDARTGSRPLVLAVILLGFGGCATIPGNPSSMSPEQIKEAVKDKSASVGCATVQTPYKGNALLLNLDAGVLKVGELTVASDCTITIKNGPMPPKAP